MSPSRMSSSGLLVTGLDLHTLREVHVDDAPRGHWRAKSVIGDRSLVCLLCYLGDEAPAGSCVPLAVKGGRVAGKVRCYFSHAQGRAPGHGHSPESQWHFTAKNELARWAAAQPGVVSAVPERCVGDLARRADVLVTFTDGSIVALEVQRSPLPDGAWLERHHSYQDRGITDVWIYPPAVAAHQVIFTEGMPLWRFDTGRGELGLGVAAAHERRPGWEAAPDLTLFARHTPPCVGDRITTVWTPLEQLRLTPPGIAIPAAVLQQLEEDRAAVCRDAERIRRWKTQNTPRRTGKAGAARSPLPPVPAGPARPVVMRLPGARPSTGEGESGWGDRAWICPECGHRSGLHPCRICHYEEFRWVATDMSSE